MGDPFQSGYTSTIGVYTIHAYIHPHRNIHTLAFYINPIVNSRDNLKIRKMNFISILIYSIFMMKHIINFSVLWCVVHVMVM